MFDMWNVWDMRCLGCVIFGVWMLVVRHVGFETFAGIWNVDLQNNWGLLECSLNQVSYL